MAQTTCSPDKTWTMSLRVFDSAPQKSPLVICGSRLVACSLPCDLQGSFQQGTKNLSPMSHGPVPTESATTGPLSGPTTSSPTFIHRAACHLSRAAIRSNGLLSYPRAAANPKPICMKLYCECNQLRCKTKHETIVSIRSRCANKCVNATFPNIDFTKQMPRCG